MGDETKETKEAGIQELFTATLRKAFGREAIMLGAFSVVMVSATIYATQAFAQTVDSRVDAGIVKTELQVEELREKLRQHEAESSEVHTATRADLHEIQADVRALYKALMTGAPQPRLEKPQPQPDGGP